MKCHACNQENCKNAQCRFAISTVRKWLSALRTRADIEKAWDEHPDVVMPQYMKDRLDKSNHEVWRTLQNGRKTLGDYYFFLIHANLPDEETNIT